MNIAAFDREIPEVRETRRELIRSLSDRLLFTSDPAKRTSLLIHLRTEIAGARQMGNAHDPALCPRCLEQKGQRTEEASDAAHDLYRCASCGQVWTVKGTQRRVD